MVGYISMPAILFVQFYTYLLYKMKLVFSKNAIVAQGPIQIPIPKNKPIPFNSQLQPKIASRAFSQEGMIGRLMGLPTKCNSCGR